MTTMQIPQFVDPYQLAQRQEQINGVIPLNQLARLTQAIGLQEGVCNVKIHFGRDSQRQVYLQGQLKTVVMQSCQRCLQPMSSEVESDFLLAIVSSDELAAHLPRQYEPIVMQEDELALWPMIEDEILLSLPIVSYHAEDKCNFFRLPEESNPEKLPSSESLNPFHTLKDLPKRS